MTRGKSGVCGCGKCGRWFNFNKIVTVLRENLLVLAAAEMVDGTVTVSAVICPHCGAENPVV